MNEFKRGDKVKLNFSFQNKLAGFLFCLWYKGSFRWPPRTAIVLSYQEEMIAYEVVSLSNLDKNKYLYSWFVTPEHMEKIDPES